MKILLIQPPNSELISRISIGLLSIGSYISKYTSHEVKIVDLASYIKSGEITLDEKIYINCSKFILENFTSDIYAFSTLVTNEIPALQIAKYLKKEMKTCTIIFGNQWATLNDIDIMSKFIFVDYIVRGEGEKTYVDLLEQLSRGTTLSGVKGITYRIDSNVIQNEERELIENLDSIPEYDYDLLNPKYNKYSRSEFGGHYGLLEFGRGCPYECIFCSTSVFWHRRVRTYSIERTIKEMLRLKEMGYDFIDFTYDNFGTNRQEIINFCDSLIKNKVDMKYSIRCRLDFLDPLLISKLRMSGCISVLVGIESGSINIVNRIGKNINYRSSFTNVNHLIESGIRVDASFITGFEFETIRDVNMTIKLAAFLHSYGKLADAEIHFVAPIPGTKFANEAVKSKKLNFSKNANISPSFSSYLSWNRLLRKNSDSIRLQDDQELINSHPNIFCAYGYYENKLISSEYFACVSTYVNKLIEFYPMTMYLLICQMEKEGVDFVSNFNEFSKKRKYYINSLINHKMDVSDKFENKNNSKDNFLLELFNDYVSDSIYRTEYIIDVLNYEKILGDLSKNIELHSNCEDFTVILSKDSLLISKVNVSKFNFNVIEKYNEIRQYFITSNNCLNTKEFNKENTYYAFELNKELSRYSYSVNVSVLSEDIYYILNEMKGEKNLGEIVSEYFNCNNKDELEILINVVIDFLNTNKNIWCVKIA